MNIDDVKKIAIEKYGVPEKDLVITEDRNNFHFSIKQSFKSYTVIKKSGLVLIDPTWVLDSNWNESCSPRSIYLNLLFFAETFAIYEKDGI